MFGLVATGAPLRYSVPVVPDSVTATCDQVFRGNCPPPVSCCSAPPPPVVIAKRSPAPPPLMVMNMFTVVPVPKSKTRAQVSLDAGLTQADTVKADRPLTIPAGRLTYSPPPLSLTALPSCPEARGPAAPPAGISLIVATSALLPLPIMIESPMFIPAVLLTLTLVSPGLAGAARPELARPSRQWPPAESVVPGGMVTVEKMACWVGCSVKVQPEMSTAVARVLESSMNALVGLSLVPVRNSLILIGLTLRTFSVVVSDCLAPVVRFVHETTPRRSPLKAPGPEVTVKTALTVSPGATRPNFIDFWVVPGTNEVQNRAGTAMLNSTSDATDPVALVNVTVASCEAPGVNVWSPGGVAVADAGDSRSRCTSYPAATMLACTRPSVASVGYPAVITPS